MKKKSFRQRHPLFKKTLTGLVLAYFIPVLLMSLFSLPFEVMKETMGNTENTAANFSVIAASLAALLIHRRWFREEFSGCFNLKLLQDKRVNVIILTAFCVLVAISVVPNWIIHGITVPSLYMLTAALDAGIGEETIFRAFPVSVLMRGDKGRKRIIFTMIFTSLLFGMTHAVNLKAGADFQGTIVQIISASCSGLLLCTIFLRTGSILPGMLFHTLYDYACFMQSNMATGIVGKLASTDILLECIGIAVEIAAIILLLRGHLDDIKKLWSNIWRLPGESSAPAETDAER